MISDIVKVAIVAAVPGTLAAILEWRNGKRNKRSQDALHEKISNADNRIVELQVSVDGRLSQLLAAKDQLITAAKEAPAEKPSDR